MKYTVYQLPIEHDLTFRCWKEYSQKYSLRTPREFTNEHLKDWKKVYDGEVADMHDSKNILERIFVTLNVNRPEDYRTRSLSTSDIIELENGELWFCDSLGWVQLK